MVKLTFLTANEKLDSGLLQSQLVKPVERHFANATFINIHRPFANRFTSEKNPSINIPCLLPPRFVHFRSFFFFCDLLCLVYALAIASRLFFTMRKRMFIARGYLSGQVAWWIKWLFRSKYVFDARSLYVHEHVGAGHIKPGSLVQRYWLWVERRVVERAEAIACVSEGMASYYHSLPTKTDVRTVLIPCFAETKKQCSTKDRIRMRDAFGFAEDELIIAYFGSMDTGWNNLKMYQEFFKAVGKANVKILIVSQDAVSLRKTSLREMAHVRIIGGEETTGFGGPAQLLDCADYGVVLMGEVPDWKTRLSVKFAEYACRGLPVIVGKYVGEAARLVQTFNLEPCVIADDYRTCPELRKATLEERERIRAWAADYFSSKNILKLLDVVDDGR